MEFVVVPRRRSYWIEEIEDGGDRRVIARYSSEDDAMARLRHLRARQQAREQRQMALEVSGYRSWEQGRIA